MRTMAQGHNCEYKSKGDRYRALTRQCLVGATPIQVLSARAAILAYIPDWGPRGANGRVPGKNPPLRVGGGGGTSTRILPLHAYYTYILTPLVTLKKKPKHLNIALVTHCPANGEGEATTNSKSDNFPTKSSTRTSKKFGRLSGHSGT